MADLSQLPPVAATLAAQYNYHPDVVALCESLHHDDEVMRMAVASWAQEAGIDGGVPKMSEPVMSARKEPPRAAHDLPHHKSVTTNYSSAIAAPPPAPVQHDATLTDRRGRTLPSFPIPQSPSMSPQRAAQATEVNLSDLYRDSSAAQMYGALLASSMSPAQNDLQGTPSAHPRDLVVSPSHQQPHDTMQSLHVLASPQRRGLVGRTQEVSRPGLPTESPSFTSVERRPLRMPNHRYNILQQAVVPIFLTGRSVLATAGAHSGRSTTLLVIAEKIIDMSNPGLQMVVLADSDAFPKICQLLAYYIALSRVVVVHDIDYATDPMGALPQHYTVVPRVPVFVVGNAENLTPFAVGDVIMRMEARQFVLLLDDRLGASEELGAVAANAAGGIPYDCVNPRHIFRDAVVAAGGTGDYLIDVAESKKFNLLQRILGLMFDRSIVVVVASARRKVDRLAEALSRDGPAVAIHSKAPESVTSGNRLLRATVEANSQEPHTAHHRRLIAVCDPYAVPFVGTLHDVSMVVYFDLPPQASLVGEHRRFRLQGGRAAGPAEMGVADDDCVFVVMVADRDERDRARQTAIEWIGIDA